jgi:hypothetical protein
MSESIASRSALPSRFQRLLFSYALGRGESRE